MDDEHHLQSLKEGLRSVCGNLSQRVRRSLEFRLAFYCHGFSLNLLFSQIRQTVRISDSSLKADDHSFQKLLFVKVFRIFFSQKFQLAPRLFHHRKKARIKQSNVIRNNMAVTILVMLNRHGLVNAGMLVSTPVLSGTHEIISNRRLEMIVHPVEMGMLIPDAAHFQYLFPGAFRNGKTLAFPFFKGIQFFLNPVYCIFRKEGRRQRLKRCIAQQQIVISYIQSHLFQEALKSIGSAQYDWKRRIPETLFRINPPSFQADRRFIAQNILFDSFCPCHISRCKHTPMAC